MNDLCKALARLIDRIEPFDIVIVGVIFLLLVPSTIVALR